MTTAFSAHAGAAGPADGGLSAHCPTCGVYLELLPDVEVVTAVASFDVHHPRTGSAVHSAGLPWGWRRAAYGPGALSQ